MYYIKIPVAKGLIRLIALLVSCSYGNEVPSQANAVSTVASNTYRASSTMYNSRSNVIHWAPVLCVLKLLPASAKVYVKRVYLQGNAEAEICSKQLAVRLHAKIGNVENS